MTRHPFPVRLTLARQMIARGAASVPGHLADHARLLEAFDLGDQG
jgi:hypothetical protein